MPHPATLPPDRLLADCEVRRQRRSGPGGQHRNKVSSGIFLRHRSTGIEVSATERRSQAENQRVAIERLRVRLAADLRTPVGDTAIPSELWKKRCIDSRLKVSDQHSDFPALLAEALDILADGDWNLVAAAERLGCSRTQLVNLIHLSPEAFQRLNARRVDLGMRPLKSS